MCKELIISFLKEFFESNNHTTAPQRRRRGFFHRLIFGPDTVQRIEAIELPFVPECTKEKQKAIKTIEKSDVKNSDKIKQIIGSNAHPNFDQLDNRGGRSSAESPKVKSAKFDAKKTNRITSLIRFFENPDEKAEHQIRKKEKIGRISITKDYEDFLNRRIREMSVVSKNLKAQHHIGFINWVQLADFGPETMLNTLYKK